MECRLGCGACCIAPSISSLNKPAGERCKYLNTDNLCSIFGKPERPQVCSDFKACDWICGNNNAVALQILTDLETTTAPSAST
ncbi:YkgJ family cysteine cluster protein [Ferrimonas lipolytica]|uniref:YkgJ family cysteine cluster protein n=1 Tax=Ferrimonas lipolytica TaxID=2724191 RepID=A0A6H1UGT4_9GAMM|nr:YkgJ family cysteine cluster protein [Ferrimonas lipolytica]QIZ78254.1 YkgJ family cysteine cluster protein [Ferrimonas lipolytica]